MSNSAPFIMSDPFGPPGGSNPMQFSTTGGSPIILGAGSSSGDINGLELAGHYLAVDNNGDTIGFALTGLSGVTGGKFEVSADGGTTWSEVTLSGSLSSNQALLVSGNDLLRFTPDAKSSGTAAFTFDLWDGTGGNVTGDLVSITSQGGSAPFSTQSLEFDVSVAKSNEAPTLDTSLIRGAEQMAGKFGTPVSGHSFVQGFADANSTTLIDGTTADGDGDPIGIVITKVEGVVAGTLQISSDNGSTWTTADTSNLSETHGLLISAATLVRYSAPQDQTGTRTITFHAWDGTGNLSTGNYVDVTAIGTGGTKPFSSETATHTLTLDPFVNTAPVLDKTIAHVDNFAAGTAGVAVDISHFLQDSDGKLGTTQDADGDPLGIVITGISGLTTGSVEISSDDGTSWTTLPNGTLSETSGLVLAAGTLLRYTPPSDVYNTTRTITYHVWDGNGGYNTGDLVNVTQIGTGGSHPFSTNTTTHTLNINANNLNAKNLATVTGDKLTGTVGIDSIDGGKGNDTMTGGDGNDLYKVDSTGDVIIETATKGSGTDTVNSTATYTLAKNIENLNLSGTAAINGTGNESDNAITGNSGANKLMGLAGNDTLSGGAGNDSLIGGLGNDSIDGGDGSDTVTYSGKFSGYSITFEDDTTIITDIDSKDGNDGTDILKGVEKIQFSNFTLNSDSSTSEFQVNTYSKEDQAFPSIAASTNGNYLITWASTGQDGSSSGIYAQLYDSNNNHIGGEFQVSTTSKGNQSYSQTTSLKDGGYVVTWSSSDGQDGQDDGVFAQRLDANGNAVGKEFQVNTNTASSQYEPELTGLDDGGFVITWTSYLQDGSFHGVYGQRYDANGARAGNEFQINTYTNDFQSQPSVTSLSDGGFVVSWTSKGQDGSKYGIYSQMYGDDGSKVGAETHVSTYTSDNQERSDITALNDGGYVITWSSYSQDGSGFGIYGQRFNASGQKAGDEFQINTHTADHQEASKIAGLSDGGFVVTWQSSGQDGSGRGIYAQRFDSTGAKVGTEFVVNATRADNQMNPDVAATNDGGFVITWASNNQDGSKAGVYAVHYDANGIPTNQSPEIQASEKSETTTLGDEGVGGGFNAGAGDDTVNGGIADDDIRGGIGNDAINSGAGNDTVTGDAGNDILNGGAGSDNMDGGEGNDLYIIASGADHSQAEINDRGGDSGDEVRFTNADKTSTDTLTLFKGDTGVDSVTIGTGTAKTAVNTGTANLNVDASAVVNSLTITGNAGNNNITSGAGDDVLLGDKGNDTLVAGDGNDILNGGIGADLMKGGAGNDTYTVDNVGDTVDEESNTDIGDTVIYNITANANLASTITLGTTNTIALLGTATDTLDLTNIENIVLNTNGKLNVEGDGNANTIIGNLANNILSGNAGDDVINGGLGNDTLNGGEGNDTLNGDAGIDNMSGGAGDDTYIINLLTDVIADTSGNDTVKAEFSIDLSKQYADLENVTLLGKAAINATGDAGNNVLIGNIANNILNGGLGDDTLNGAEGNDLYIFGSGDEHALAEIQDSAGTADELRFTGATITNASTATANTLSLYAGDTGIEKVVIGTGLAAVAVSSATTALNVDASSVLQSISITGNAGVNALKGGEGNDTLLGGKGADVLVGNDGNDILDGGTEADNMTGGAGNDTYIIDNIADTIDEDSNTDTSDTVIYNMNVSNLTAQVSSLTLGASNDNAIYLSNSTVAKPVITSLNLTQIENITLNGGGLINVTGNEVANAINGNSGNNSISGAAGNDILSGGAGNDTLDGGNDNDQLDGGVGNDQLLAGAGDDTLAGGVGNDTLTGSDGNDVYLMSDANDFIIETANGGTDTVQASITFSLVDTAKTGTNLSNIENLTLTGSGAINGTGNAANNTLTGNTGANKLDGGDGSDTLLGLAGNDNLLGGKGNDELHGGLGNDTLLGGDGNDTFVFDTALNATTNKDVIQSFNTTDDVIRLDHTIFTALSEGSLDAGSFVTVSTGTTVAAADANDFILYNSKTGALYYDADGNGTEFSAVQLTTLTTPVGTLSASDFIVS